MTTTEDVNHAPRTRTCVCDDDRCRHLARARGRGNAHRPDASILNSRAGGGGGGGAGTSGGTTGAGGVGGPGGSGGGVYNAGGTVTVTGTTMRGNTSGNGGAGGHGGGGGPSGAVAALSGAGSTVQSVTIAGNSSGAGSLGGDAGAGSPGGTAGRPGPSATAGGVFDDSTTTTTVQNTLLVSNTGGNCGPGGIVDLGHNLSFGGGGCPGTFISGDPNLGPLDDNGGPTETVSLGSGSAAIDKVPPTGAGCQATDQRGVPRRLRGPLRCGGSRTRRLRGLASPSDTRALIETAVKRFLEEVPALQQLKLVAGLELRGRGDVQLYRVEVPGPKISKDIPADAKVTLALARSHFNELATKGRVKDWRAAFDHGDVKATGVEQVMKLIVNVVERQEERARTRKASSGAPRPASQRR
jgi:hypothetical protein